MDRRRFRALRWRWGGDVTFRRADHAGTERRNDFPGRGDVTFRRADHAGTEWRNDFPGRGDFIFRRAGPGFFRAAARRQAERGNDFPGAAISPFDARTTFFPGAAISSFDAPGPRGGRKSSEARRRRTGRELFAGKSGNRLDGMHQRSILRTSTEESTEELFLALPDGPSAIWRT